MSINMNSSWKEKFKDRKPPRHSWMRWGGNANTSKCTRCGTIRAYNTGTVDYTKNGIKYKKISPDCNERK